MSCAQQIVVKRTRESHGKSSPEQSNLAVAEADSGPTLHYKNTFPPSHKWQQKEQNWPKIGHGKHSGINTGTSNLVLAVELGSRAKAEGSRGKTLA